MKSFYRVMLGEGSKYADECFNGNFIGAHFGIQEDLSPHLYDNWRDFNQHFIPVWMNGHPGKSKIAAGLACGALWTVSKGIQKGDIVLCPNGAGAYFVGEVTDNYSCHPDEILPHRRTVRWYNLTIDRASLSDALRKSAGSIGTVSNVSGYAQEIEGLISGTQKPFIVATDETIEDAAVFGLEKHLEEFLIQNWKVTELGQNYNVYEEDGQLVGQQYPSDTGPIDILAISKDRKELLIVELKKGRASDSVVGQIQRYMGYVQEELAESDQKVKGIIIALEDDLRIRRALVVAPNIEFYRYQVSFKLFKS